MADKQHYVKMTFEFGNDIDGEFTPKNRGEAVWVSMPLEDAVTLQNHAIIPAITEAIEKAGELGLAAIGGMPDNVKPKGKPV